MSDKEKFTVGQTILFEGKQRGVVTEYLAEEKQVRLRLDTGRVLRCPEGDVKPAPEHKQIKGPE